jgi:hypothetical protein
MYVHELINIDMNLAYGIVDYHICRSFLEAAEEVLVTHSAAVHPFANCEGFPSQKVGLSIGPRV